MNYDRVLGSLPSKMIYETQFWDMLEWIRGPDREFTLDELKLKIKDAYNLENAEEFVEEIVDKLVSMDVIKDVNGRFTKTDKFDEFLRFLKCHRSVTNIVAWGVWYLYKNGLNNFELSQIMEVLSKIDKNDVEKALKQLKLEYKVRILVFR